MKAAPFATHLKDFTAETDLNQYSYLLQASEDVSKR